VFNVHRQNYLRATFSPLNSFFAAKCEQKAAGVAAAATKATTKCKWIKCLFLILSEN